MTSAGGHLLMVAAPSGAGKSSLVNAFLAKNDTWRLSVSTTTRPPRPGEQNGREYVFTHPEDFRARAAQGEFLEWAEVHGNLYGTSRQWIEEELSRRHNIILEIDWQGARQIREIFKTRRPPPVSVFILPPSMEALRERLKSRGQDPEAVIAQRLASAKDEISHSNEFDYVIINQEFSQALQEFAEIANRLLGSS